MHPFYRNITMITSPYIICVYEYETATNYDTNKTSLSKSLFGSAYPYSAYISNMHKTTTTERHADIDNLTFYRKISE